MMSSNGIASVDVYTRAIEKLLDRARQIKPHNGSEPALTATDFGGGIEEIGKLSNNSFVANSQAHYAAIETACRNIFYHLLASTTVGDPTSSEIWNLLDVISILSDIEQCEPSLVFWLVEELLDSQTIDGCRNVFDYLDSRRERITAKHFKKKELIILRACNELLRRLSRAEDTVFCGRVFIFLFQSFPLGDRSSVNLRGNFHVENVTVFEDSPPLAPRAGEATLDGKKVDAASFEGSTSAVSAAGDGKENAEQGNSEGKMVEANEQHATQGSDDPLETNKLYPIFWSLQEYFSMPTRLFDSQHFKVFKDGLDLTIRKFQSVHQELQARGPSKYLDDNKRPTKRKRDGPEDEILNSFNPRYLTSKDLFELEISDLAFRRHVLVQALILVDFLLSLTPKAKKKLEHSTNKAVLYSYALNEDDATWATQMRSEIAMYLQQGLEGKFYYRMVDTVLSRDKNWAHWKADGCPLIARTPVSASEFASAQKGAQKVCINKKLRATPVGSLDLRFLSDGGNTDGLEKLKHPDRYSIPSAESFKDQIAEEDFNIEVAKAEEDKQLATNARSSKLWRALRIASKNKFNLFDQIDDGNNLQALFHHNSQDGDENQPPKGEENNEELLDEAAGKETTTTSNPAAAIDIEEESFQNGGELPQETAVI